ncbi:MAG: hypothetical protein AAF593_12390 [Planctomycetota bacterium]
MPWIDWPLAVLIYVYLLLSVHKYFQEDDRYSPAEKNRGVWRAFRRMLYIGVPVILLFFWLDIAFWLTAIITACVIIFTTNDFFDGFVVALPLLALGAAIQQYILGFPDLIHRDQAETALTGIMPDAFEEFVGRETMARSAFRPEGDVEIDGKILAAVEERHKMVSSNTRLVVTGRRGHLLVVKEIT